MVNLYKVVITKLAMKRLSSIYFNLKDKVSLKVAVKVRKSLLDESKKLDKMPTANPLLFPNEKPNIRYRFKWSYRIIFEIFESKKTVRVLDFAHDKEDLEKIKKRLK